VVVALVGEREADEQKCGIVSGIRMHRLLQAMHRMDTITLRDPKFDILCNRRYHTEFD